ncbi:MAG: hypothetical protein JSV56_13365, partial [Methanomassiliicoccales archaeon]
MDSPPNKVLVIVVAIIVIIAGISAVILTNLEKVQEFYENIIDKDERDGKDEWEDSNGPDSPDDHPGISKPISQMLKRILSSSSGRKIGSQTTVVSSNSEFFSLIGTPIAIDYQGTTMEASPLLVSSGASSKFLEVYNATNIITLGDVGGVSTNLQFSGDEKSASLNAAENIWSYSSGALIIEKNKNGYELGVAATVLASYLNIPIIVTNTLDSAVQQTLSKLGVSYTIICGNVNGYGETYYLSSLDEVYDLSLGFLKERFGRVSYITITNSEDVSSQYGISKISCLAAYLSSFYEGVVLNCPQPRLSSSIFQDSDEKIEQAANEANLCIKTDLEKLLGKLKNQGLYANYLNATPYLAILGDPYSIPFYYFKNPNPSTSTQSDDAWVATDDYYANLDNESHQIELAPARVLALSVGGVSALISRSLFYNDYIKGWKADSTMSEAKNAEWKDTAYAAKGDDWNGAMWVMTPDYWYEVNYLQSKGYTVHTTQRRATGATVSQDILCYYSSSSMIYVMAHGSADSYQMTDGVESSDVRNWDMGPSVQILTSCSAGRTDVPDIENTISLTFIEVGVNAYIGGSRTESSADSPALS